MKNNKTTVTNARVCTKDNIKSKVSKMSNFLLDQDMFGMKVNLNFNG